MIRVVLKPRKARPLFARHPWVFAGSIARLEGERGPLSAEPSPGEEVAVVSHEGAFVARGLYNPASAIRVRLYRWEDEPLDASFWADRVDAALRLRRDVLGLDKPGGACRLIFSEGDGLSGLTVDRYDRWLVAQFTSLALFERRDALLDVLAEKTGCEGIFLRTERGIASREGLNLPPQTEAARGTLPDAPISIVENGLTFEVDPRAGQKTGFYLDQRNNRAAVAAMASGRRVLDLFCYSGAFALGCLATGGATYAMGVDSSAPAIELARRNAVANKVGHARFETADVFEALAKLRDANETFGLVICDPPKFARSAQAVDDAVRGYVRLNTAALSVLSPGGVLATCSCSGNIDRNTFAQVLGLVAEATGRTIQVLDQKGQAADHPVSASCLESDYLKCFLCRVS
jgi:23S rRNA (cytosine1962-C5)-methyltransferase